jgi:hypothetical protein
MLIPMTLWGLLLGICVAMGIAGAMSAASEAQAGLSGYALGGFAGLLVGAAAAWGMRAAVAKVVSWVAPYPDARKERYVGALYLGAVFWVLLVLFLGGIVASPIIRAVR